MKGTVVVRVFLWRITGPCNEKHKERKNTSVTADNNNTGCVKSLAENYTFTAASNKPKV